MKFSNKLSDSQIERLAVLLEELGEAQQAIGKILRHGYNSYHPLSHVMNRNTLERELGDVLFAIRLIQYSGDVDNKEIQKACVSKARRVTTYLHHQKSMVPSE